jgi:hypothetical protein
VDDFLSAMPLPNPSKYHNHWLTQTLAPFIQYNAWNSSLKEFWGSNVPHLLLVASVGEFWDQFINQIGNNLLVFGGGLSVEKLADKVLRFLSPAKFREGLSEKAKESYHLGKGFVIYPMIAASVIASPFLRNAIMSHVTKKDNFVEIAGVQGTNQQGNPSETATHKQTRLAKEAKDMATVGQIMGVGALLGAFSLGLTHRAIANNLPLPAWMKKEVKPFWQKEAVSFNSLFTLPDGDYRKVQDAPLYLFWALAAYAGLLLASRDPVEFTENVAKTVWFGFAFMIAPRLIEKPLEKFFADKSNDFLGSSRNMTYIAKLAVGSVLYAGMPTVMNRVFRHRRAEKAGLITASNLNVQTPTPFVPSTRTTLLPMSSNRYPSVGFYQTSVMAGI